MTAGAVPGLERCRRFLATKNPLAARRAAAAIANPFLLLETHPDIGRPHPDEPGLREFLIPFGATGYAALYRFVPAENSVFILAFRHQKEAGY
ncbi:type II toxin-antitoxin system RelE/ParE family toxin [Mesorhizobium sp. A556]